jgi:hypothetical protein
MKALISPNEVFEHTWVTSWKQENQKWIPDTTETIVDCQRVAQVEPDEKIFPVAQVMFWIDCPDNCSADVWYYKDGQVQPKPQNVLKPTGE